MARYHRRMPLASATDLHLAHGTNVLLDGVTLSIEPGERLGLVGRNGQGKSTILRILAGELVPDSGTVQLERGTRIAYLPQHPKLDPALTVHGAALGALGEQATIKQDLEALFDRMAHATGAELDGLLLQQAALEHRLEAAGGYATEHLVEQALQGVGFVEAQYQQPVSSLSGGQRGRLGLARVLLERADLLLLDEPTNHLDLDGCRWLEAYLADSFTGAAILVSHDRWLLDRVVDRIEEIEQGALSDYPGNYAQYRALRAERQLAQARVHQKQLDRIKREEEFIRRYRAGQRARQARGRETRLERYRSDHLIERPTELDMLEVRLPPAPRVGDHVLVARGLAKSFGQRRLFRNLDLSIEPGERIGIVGPNGSGKTTLVRCLLGEETVDSGDIRTSPQLRAAWFRQTHDHLDLSLSVWQYLQSVIVGEDGGARASEQQARNLAGAFLFSGADQDKPLRVLSGGERGRAIIAGLVAGAKNLIVLDEPTNHLDIPSTERLEAALATSPEDGGFGGAIILVSHDRALLANVCDRLVVLDGFGQWSEVRNDVTAWLETSAAESAPPTSEAPPASKHASRNTSTQRSRQETRSRDTDGRKVAEPSASPKVGAPDQAARRLMKLSQEELEQRIERIEARLRAVDAQLADASTWANPEKAQRLPEERARMTEELAPLEREWSRRADEPGEP